MKKVRIQCFSGPYFPVFGLNTERHRVSLGIQSVCEEIRASKASNADTFHAMTGFYNTSFFAKFLLVLPDATTRGVQALGLQLY